MLTISFATPVQVYLVLITPTFSVQLKPSLITISFVSLMHQVYLITASSIKLFYLIQSTAYFNCPSLPYFKFTFIKNLQLLYLAFQLQSCFASQHYSFQLLLILFVI